MFHTRIFFRLRNDGLYNVMNGLRVGNLRGADRSMVHSLTAGIP